MICQARSVPISKHHLEDTLLSFGEWVPVILTLGMTFVFSRGWKGLVGLVEDHDVQWSLAYAAVVLRSITWPPLVVLV